MGQRTNIWPKFPSEHVVSEKQKHEPWELQKMDTCQFSMVGCLTTRPGTVVVSHAVVPSL